MPATFFFAPLWLVALVSLVDPALGNPMKHRLAGRPCEHWRDPEGLVHVRAKKELVLNACIGYAQGLDRAFQMDFLRRTAQGRRSEILGPGSLKLDLGMRLLSIEERARWLVAELPEREREKLWAYSHGVNLGFEAAIRQGVREFKELGYLPEDWLPHHTIALLLLQSFDQTRKAFEREIDESEWLGRHGERAVADYSPDGLPWDTPILSAGEYPARGSAAGTGDREISKGTAVSARSGLASLLGSPVETGSNNWAIAPSRSASGKAWLANDPHLSLLHPPFWHWIHVSGAGVEAVGAALPGVPAIASGTNLSVAWGLTNSYLDVADLALVPDSELEGEIAFRPLVWVRWAGFRWPFVFKRFRRTREGWPVLPLPAPEGQAIVLRWSGNDVTPTGILPIFGFMRAKSAREIDALARTVELPSWNLVFADVSGVIGYRAFGLVPKRRSAPSFGIESTSLEKLRNERKWEYLGWAEMPAVLGPRRGWLATANNRQWPSDSSIHPGRAHTPSFRAFRIHELLRETGKADFASIRRIQCDRQATDARFLLRPVLESAQSSPVEDELARLSAWDLETGKSCLACYPYRKWVNTLMDENDLDEAALFRRLGDPGFRASALATLQGILKSPGRPRDWGEAHRLPFTHLSKDIRFSWDPMPSGGDKHSVNPGTMESDGDRFSQTSGASQRLIVELARPPRVSWTLAGSERSEDRPWLARTFGPWASWDRCEYQTARFPIDWDEVAATYVSL